MQLIIIYIITPSLKIDISLYPFSSFFVFLPLATFTISEKRLSASSPVLPFVINLPASKSIQLFFLLKSSVFVDILIVGSGAPSGVPLPVVNKIICAPAAVRLVTDTISLPGPVSRFSPFVLHCSP